MESSGISGQTCEGESGVGSSDPLHALESDARPGPSHFPSHFPPALTRQSSSQGSLNPFDPFDPYSSGVPTNPTHSSGPTYGIGLPGPFSRHPASTRSLGIETDVDNLRLVPPMVRHQGSSDTLSPAIYRSVSGFGCEGGSPDSSAYDEYDEAPIYRSLPPMLSSAQPGGQWGSGSSLFASMPPGSPRVAAGGPYGMCSVGDPFGSTGEPFGGMDDESSEGDCYRSLSATYQYAPFQSLAAAHHPCCEVPRGEGRSSFCFALAVDELFHVLQLLEPKDAFAAMRVCTAWRDVAAQIYARRAVRVPAQPDALLQRIQQANAGDTLLLEPGVHLQSAIASVDKPLRLRAAPAPGGEDAALVPDSQPVVVVSTSHMLLHAKCNMVVEGLTLIRMGAGAGYPNAVVALESGRSTMERCRISCGGLSADVEEALGAFAAPAPGARSPTPGAPALRPGAAEAPAPQDPQSGVWVGAAADVTLRHCLISCCLGPGIKIYRGRLHAERNAIAFSRCGGNVVANGGRISLLHNTIRGAQGDGFVSWSNTHVQIDSNHIHGNTGAGIAIKAGGGSVSITNNCVFDNSSSAVMFANTSKQATLNGNHKPDNTPVEALQQQH